MSVNLGLSRSCSLPNISDAGVSSVVSFLNLSDRRTLSKVSHYFREFLASETIQRQFLAQQPFKPFSTGQESTVQQYARFQAMHSPCPNMVHDHTLPIAGRACGVCITPDGSKMVVLTRDPCGIVCYDLLTMRQCWTWDLDDLSFAARDDCRLLITPDGTKMVFYNVQRPNAHLIKPGLIVIDMQTGQQMLQFAQEEEHFGVLNMNLDGKSIDTGNYLGIIKRWDLATGQCIKTFEKEKQNILQISPNGKMAISKNGEGFAGLTVWDVETGAILQTLMDKGTYFGLGWNKIEICQNNKIAILGSWMHKSVQVFDLTSGVCIDTLKFTDKKFTAFEYLRIFPNGKFVVGGNRHYVALFNLATKRCQVIDLHPREISDHCVHISPDEMRMVIGRQGAIELWNFCELPEKHLTRLNDYLVRQKERYASPILVTHLILPKFVQEEVREIAHVCQLPVIDSFVLYNATQVALPAIEKHLERAREFPRASQQMAGEAMRRILALPGAVTGAVCKNFYDVRKERLEFHVKEDPYIVFQEALTCEFFIADCLEAIHRTMQDYKNKFPLLDKCLADYRKGQGSLIFRVVPGVISCAGKIWGFLEAAQQKALSLEGKK